MIRIRTLSAIPYPGVVLALCVVATMGFSLLTQGMGVLYPFIQEELNTTSAQLGLISSGQWAGTAATVLFTGWLADVLGARRLLTTSLIIVAVGLLLFSQMQSVVQGVLVGVLMGIGFSGSGPGNTKAIMDWISRRMRGMAMGVREATITVGGIIAAGLLTFLAVTYDWRITMIVMAVITATSATLFFIFYRDKPDSLADSIDRADTTTKPTSKIPQVVRNVNIWLGAAFGISVGVIHMVIAAYLVLFLKADLGMSSGEAGGMLAILMAGGAVGRIGWAMVSDLMFKGQRVEVLGFVSLMALVSTALMALLPSTSSLPVVALLVFVVGVMTVGRSGVYVVFVAELAGPELTGTAIGFNAMIGILSGVVVTPLFGFIADQTGSYAMSWWMMAAFSGAGITMLAILGSRIRAQ